VSPEEGFTVFLGRELHSGPLYLSCNLLPSPTHTSKTKENYPQITRKLAEIENKKSNGLLNKGKREWR